MTRCVNERIHNKGKRRQTPGVRYLPVMPSIGDDFEIAVPTMKKTAPSSLVKQPTYDADGFPKFDLATATARGIRGRLQQHGYVERNGQPGEWRRKPKPHALQPPKYQFPQGVKAHVRALKAALREILGREPVRAKVEETAPVAPAPHVSETLTQKTLQPESSASENKAFFDELEPNARIRMEISGKSYDGVFVSVKSVGMDWKYFDCTICLDDGTKITGRETDTFTLLDGVTKAAAQTTAEPTEPVTETSAPQMLRSRSPAHINEAFFVGLQPDARIRAENPQGHSFIGRLLSVKPLGEEYWDMFNCVLVLDDGATYSASEYDTFTVLDDSSTNAKDTPAPAEPAATQTNIQEAGPRTSMTLTAHSTIREITLFFDAIRPGTKLSYRSGPQTFIGEFEHFIPRSPPSSFDCVIKKPDGSLFYACEYDTITVVD